ncbi:MAG: ATP-binding protein [Pseudomonadota bacterium]
MIKDILLKIPIFQSFDDHEISIIEKVIKKESFPKDHLIFNEGDIGNVMYILVNGSVGIYKSNEDYEKIKLTTMQQQGDFFGEMSLFDKKPRSASVVALEEVDLLKLTRKDLFATIDKDPSIFRKMFEEFSLRFRDFNEKYFKDMALKNRELNDVNKKLRRLDEMKTKFINLASHELKTPLNSILNAVQMVMDQDDDFKDPLVKEFLNIIFRNSEKLETLVGNILLLSDSKEVDIQIQRKQVSAKVLLEDIKKEIFPYVKLRSHKLIVKSDNIENLFINETKMYQALVQLCFNAIKFTQDKGEITIYCKDAGDQIEFGVIDNGIGIDKKDQNLIFDYFYEVADVEMHYSGKYEFGSGGLGIGLSIAKLAANLHNGKIELESEVKKGSHFKIKLPKSENLKN